MFAYCVERLHLSEDATWTRIQAARAARQYPVLLTALGEGRLHLTAVRLLAPHVTADNVGELVAAATHKRKSEIEELLAVRFPATRMPAVRSIITPLPSRPVPGRVSSPVQPALGQAERDSLPPVQPALEGEPSPLSPDQLADSSPLFPIQPAPARVEASHAERFALHVTIDRSTHDKLRYAQALLSHCVSPGDVAEVLDRALDLLIVRLEGRNFGAAGKPRQPRPGVATNPRGSRGASTRQRHIPAHVRRAVWERDQGNCTFVGENGNRCPAWRFLEFDHVDPVARGGQATVDRIRLRCRAHNQYEAERAFGVDFMREKRQSAAETRRHADRWAIVSAQVKRDMMPCVTP